MKFGHRVLRYAAALLIAAGSVYPSYAQVGEPYFRLGWGTVQGGLSNTSPDGITVSIPESVFRVRVDTFSSTTAPMVSGNDGAGTWEILRGSLPPGMVLEPASGAILGIPSELGAWNGIVLGYVDSAGRRGESVSFSIQVVSGPSLAYESDLIAQGGRYVQSPTAGGLIGDAEFEVVEGELPDGVIVDSRTGALRGTALALGVWPGIVVEVTDSQDGVGRSNAFELEVVEGGVIEYAAEVEAKFGNAIELEPTVSLMTAPIDFALADGTSLPGGLSLDEGTGVISGTPTERGEFLDLQVVADDSTGKPAFSNLFSIVVTEYSVAYDVEPFQVNTPVFFDPVVVGGVAPYSFEIDGETLLPPGLILDGSTGRIHGSVANVGAWGNIVVNVTDSKGESVPSIALAFSTVGSAIAYDDALVAMGEPLALAPEVRQMEKPIGFEIVEGSLPTGLAIDPNTGVIQGITQIVGDFPLTVQARDAGDVRVVSEPFEIVVGIPDIGTNYGDVVGRVGLPFYHTVNTENLVAPIIWESIANALPPGLDLDATTGVISGTPIEPGFFQGVVLRATDVGGNVLQTDPFTIEITEPLLLYGEVSTTSIEQPSTITPTSVDIEPDATYISIGAPLPDGLEVDPFSGDIVGQPLVNGIWPAIQVMVIEPQGWMFNSNVFTIVVGNVSTSGVQVDNMNAKVGVSFQSSVPEVDGVTGPYQWSILDGALPDGLSLNAQTGAISGIPTFAGTWAGITLLVEGADGSAASNAFRITVSDLRVVVTDVYYGRVDRAFVVEPEVLGAEGDVTWTLLGGPAPAGTDFWSNSGVIDGFPTTVGNYGPYRFRVVDSTGAEAQSIPFMISIEPALAAGDIVIDVPSVIRGRPYVDFWLRPDVETASTNLTWEVIGALPPGLGLNAATGRIQGQPTALGLYDGLQFRATSTDGKTGTSPFFAIDVRPLPGVVVDPALYNGEVGKALSIVPRHDGNVFGSTEWMVVGELPYGLRINPLTGRITGTPRQAGTFGPLNVVLIDADGAEGVSNDFNIVIEGAEVVFPEPGTPTIVGTVPETESLVCDVGFTGQKTRTRDKNVWSNGDITFGDWSAWNITACVPDNPTNPTNPTIVDTTLDTESMACPVGQTGERTRSRDRHEWSNGSVSYGSWSSWDSSSCVVTPTNPTNPGPGTPGTPTTPGTLPSIQLPGTTYKTRVGVPFATPAPQTKDATGTIVWSVSAGALPPGLSIESASGRIHGTATAVGTWSGIYLKMTAGNGSAVGGPINFLVHGPVTAAAPAAVVGRVDRALTVQATATNIVQSPTWSVVDADAQLGLSINPASGLASGKPTASGSYSAKFRVVDSFDAAAATTTGTSFTIHPDIVVGAPTIPVSVAGTSFEMAAPSVTGIIGTVSWATTGSLPPGLALDKASGVVTGTPLQAGTWQLRLRATDSLDGAFGLSPAFNIVVQPGPVALSIDYATGYTAYTDEAFTTGSPVVHGADAQVAYSLASDSAPLPAWAALNATTGAIAGTPTAAGSWGGIRVQATDGNDIATDGPITITARGFVVTAPAESKGRVGQRFGFTATAAIAKGDVTWSLASGTLPAGLVLDTRTGAVSGISNEAFVARTIALRATDAVGRTAVSGPIAISVDPTLTMLPMYRGTVGAPFETNVPVLVGVTGPVEWTSVGNALPSWANIASDTGRISGTPNAAGTSSALAIRGTHVATGLTATSGAFGIEISLPALEVVGTGGNVRERVGTAHAFPAPTVSGNVGSVSWSIARGATPAWMGIDAGTGVVTANSAAPANSGSLVLRAVDQQTGVTAETVPFSIAYVADPVASIGSTLRLKAGASGSISPIGNNIIGTATWTIDAGNLPAGMTISSGNGTISGTPTAVGVYSGIVLRVTDSHDGRSAVTGSLTITVMPDLSVTGYETSHLSHPTIPYVSQTPTLVNASGAASWSIASGTLPAGLSIDPVTGVISGTATAAANSTIVVRGTDAGSNGYADSAPINLRFTQLTATIAASHASTVTKPFQAQPNVVNAIGSVTWTLASGTLPAWASLDPATGRISGTPDTSLTHSGLSLRATDSTGVSAVTGQFTITTARGFLVSLDPVNYNGRVGVSTTLARPTAQNVLGTVVWSIGSGALPTGVGINPATGIVSGVPAVAGTFTFVVQGTDSADGAIGSSPVVTLVVDDVPAIGIDALYTTRVGANFVVSPTLTRARGTSTWYLSSGTLPDGISLNASTGVIHGMPTTVGRTDGLVLRVVDGEGASGLSQAFSIEVTEGMIVTVSPTTYNVRNGNSLTTSVPTVQGLIGSAVWSLGNGTLPQGMSVNASSGVIFGTPSQNGSFAVQLQVRDTHDSARAFSDQITIVVQPALTISGGRSTYGTHVDIPVSTEAYTVTGVVGSLTWSVATGVLPSWATLDTATGIVSGTPTAAQNIAGLSLRATDSYDGASVVSDQFAFVVLERMRIVDMATNYYARVDLPFSSYPPSASPVGGNLEWYMNTGVLPAWATLDPETGVMSGTAPAAEVTEALRLGARDGYGADERSVEFNLNVRSAPLLEPDVVVLKKRIAALQGQINFTTEAISPEPNWSVIEGSLPNGMLLGDGVISGVVPAGTETGVYPFTVQVEDSYDFLTAEAALEIQVANPLVVHSAASRTVRQGTPVSIDAPVVTGRYGEVTWSSGTLDVNAQAQSFLAQSFAALSTENGATIDEQPMLLQATAASTSSALPGGLTLDPVTGILTGTPSQTGNFSIDYLATDDWDGFASGASMTLNVTPGLSISGTAANTAINGKAMTGVVPTAHNAVGAVTWALQSGTLPTGVTVSSTTGALTGTPTQTGSFPNIVISASDTGGGLATSTAFALTVHAPVGVTLQAATLNATQNQAYAFDFKTVTSVTGGGGTVAPANFAYSVNSGSVPAGMSLAASGVLSGTPTAIGSSNFRVIATHVDASGQMTYTINVNGAVLRVSKIAAGNHHTCAITVDSGVVCWGGNSSGQLGDGTVTQRNKPVAVKGVGNTGTLANVTLLDAGAEHTCASSSTAGTVCWGRNNYNQLGDGSTSNRASPVVVRAVGGGTSIGAVSALAAGYYHTCASSSSSGVGTVCWGYNVYGALGDGTTTQRIYPTHVKDVGGSGYIGVVNQISADYQHTCAVSSGRAVCWGQNTNAKLGDGTTTNRTSPVVVRGIGGTGNLAGVTQVQTGYDFSCALSSSGSVCWGKNDLGQLGNGTSTMSYFPVQQKGIGNTGTLSGVTSLSTGSNHACGILSNGGVACWGYNIYGQIGDGTTTNRTWPVQVVGPGGVGTLDGVSQLEVGNAHSCAISRTLGTVCWGYNNSGQLGDGGTTNRYTPLAGDGMGYPAVSITLPSGAPPTATQGVSYSYNMRTQTSVSGGDGTVTASNLTWSVSSGAMPAGLTLSSSGVINGTPSSNGTSNFTIRAAYGTAQATVSLSIVVDEPPFSVSLASASLSANIDQPFAYDFKSAATILGGRGVTVSDLTWTMPIGTAPAGLLFDGNGVLSGTPTVEGSGSFQVRASHANGSAQRSYTINIGGVLLQAKQMAAGTFHACAVTTGGAAKCWGLNSTGQLGNGSTVDSSIPVDVVGLSSGVASIAMDSSQTCAVLDNGQVRCWGAGYQGALGNGATSQSSIPVAVTGISNAVAVDMSSNTVCAVLSDGGLRCWGQNGGKYGNGTTANSTTPVAISGLTGSVSQIAIGADHTCAVVGGTAQCWGSNQYGQVGNNSTVNRTTPANVSGMGSGVKRLDAGTWHTCAVDSGNNTRCWGYNNRGQIGDGTTANKSTATLVSDLSGISADVAAGSGSSCAVTSSGSVKCWGFNNSGQLGNGGNVTSSTPVDVTGAKSGIQSVTVGGDYACGLLGNGGLSCWGNSMYGQLGNGTTGNRPTPGVVNGFDGVVRIALSSVEPLNGAVGTPYSIDLKDYATIQGKVQPSSVSWSASGTMPPGMSLGSTGILQGTPTATGSFAFDVTASYGSLSDVETVSMTISTAYSMTRGSLTFAMCDAGQTWSNGRCLGTVTPLTQVQAVTYCNDLVAEGSSNWRLPSRDELSPVRTNLSNMPNTQTTGYYMTSTPNGASNAIGYQFDNGNSFYNIWATSPYPVRCVR